MDEKGMIERRKRWRPDCKKEAVVFDIIYLRSSLFWQTTFAISVYPGKESWSLWKIEKDFKVYVFALLCDGTPYEMTVTICLVHRPSSEILYQGFSCARKDSFKARFLSSSVVMSFTDLTDHI